MLPVPLLYPSLLLGILTLYRWFANNRHQRYPPGPKSLPVVGSVFHFPMSRPWEAFAAWKAKYGDIVYLNVLGRPFLILNSRKACVDLLEKRSAIYSDRPRSVMLGELLEFDWNMTLLHYSPRWREQRRLFHLHFNEIPSRQYFDIQEESTHALLLRLLEAPEGFLNHTRLAFADAILHAVYNIRVQDYNDIYVQAAERAMDIVSKTAVPVRFWVNFMPFLKHVPSWMPGARFKRVTKEWKELLKASKDVPAQAAEKDRSPNSELSVFSKILERLKSEKGEEGCSDDSLKDIAKSVAAVAYLGGADTSTSFTQALFMALANNPNAQSTAQKELDTVVGDGRLPTFNDLPNLPYTTAIVKEILRWHSVLPLGIPHRSTQDDEYEGYFIPKGTRVFSNIWAVLHDPDIYPDPFAFNPSRWLLDTPSGLQLNDAIPDPGLACFGYGRRICPGRHFARNLLLIITCNVLTCFRIAPLDDDGTPAESVKEEFTTDYIQYPKPFKIAIVPRSEKVQHLIREVNM